MVPDFFELNKRLFYFTSVVAILGHFIDLKLIELNHSVVILNYVTIIIFAITVALYYFKNLPLNAANGILIYGIFLNTVISIIIKYNEASVFYFLQFALLTAVLILYAGFAFKKCHIFIIGFSCIVFNLIMGMIIGGEILTNHLPMEIIVMLSYMFGVWYIVTILERVNLQKNELIISMRNSNMQLIGRDMELTALNKTKDKLFSVIGHDLKSPASSIMWLSQLIELKVNNGEHDALLEYSKLIYQSANSLNFQLTQILDWAQIQKQKTKIHPKKVVMESIINDMIELMHGTIYLKKTNIVFNDSCNSQFIADEQLMYAVVRNLLVNAIKYTPNGGEIIIDSRITESTYHFSITDNGVGMDDEVLRSLFINDTVDSIPGTNMEKGTGLGLAICNEYIRLHGGAIWAESKLGKGSVFHFTLPVVNNL